MKCTVLFGSPRKQGNTAAALSVLVSELKKLGVACRVFDLYEENPAPCLGCKGCQDAEGFGCVQHDSLVDIYAEIADSELLLLASPIYCWFCTAPMKAAMDRLIYATNKFYGASGKKAMLLKGKSLVALATCGYPAEKGSDVWSEGLRRWCKHGKMDYRGMLTLRDLGGEVPFMTEAYEEQTRAFARELVKSMGE